MWEKKQKHPQGTFRPLRIPRITGEIYFPSDGPGQFCRWLLRWCAGLLRLPTDSNASAYCGAAFAAWQKWAQGPVKRRKAALRPPQAAHGGRGAPGPKGR